jgi:ribosome maturation factor RimP
VKTELEVLIGTTLSELGLDLVELRIGGSARRPLIDVRMDRLDGGRVSVDDCAAVSRVLQQRLDGDPSAPGDYVLEVSSAGLERRLKRAADWKRFVGRTVSVLSPAVGGRRELELAGFENAEVEGSEVAVLRGSRGEEFRVPLSEVKEARLVFHWKR